MASNAGAPRPPAWYLNLRANPHARVELGPRSIDVRAQEATGHERAELWRRLTDANRYLVRAARKAGRDLPMMALVVLPSRVSVGWWFKTPRYAPFFRAEISAVTPTF